MDASLLCSLYKGRRVLITGGLWFIGSTLARRLAEMGDVEVNVLDAMIEGQGGNIFNIEGIEERIVLRDVSFVSALVADKDYVFNLAGSLSHIDSMMNPQQDLELNCRAQLVLPAAGTLARRLCLPVPARSAPVRDICLSTNSTRYRPST